MNKHPHSGHTQEHHCGCGCNHHEHVREHPHEHNCDCSLNYHEHAQEHLHEHNCNCGHTHHKYPHGHSQQQEHSVKYSHHTEKTCIYMLENLGCAHCAAKMEEQIRQIEGISNASITYATRQLRVTAVEPDQYLSQIRSICSRIESQVSVVKQTPKTVSSALAKTAQTFSEEEHHEDTKELCLIGIGALLFVIGVILHYKQIQGFSSAAIFVIGYLLLGGEILLEAGKNILKGQIFDENFLMSIATLGAFAIQEYPEAMGIMLFYRIGEFFEHKAVEKSRSQIMEAVDLRPETVNLILEEQIQIIPAEDAKVGDLLLIRPGDRIPLDSVVAEGESRIDTSPITGEPVPAAVKAGDSILSGCVNTSGQLKIRVEKPLSESMVTRILDAVENAAANKPQIDRFITRFARIYTPFVIFAAAAVALLPSLITGDWNYWIYTALTFLVMSCPCALVLSVPLAFFSGIGAASKKGILFKGGAVMEVLSGLKAVVMDKTGTLTHGNFKLQQVISQGTWNENDLLRICASCEQHSTHPIAHSIVSAASEKGISCIPPLSMQEIAGQGISAELPEGKILCGNRKLMEAFSIDISNAHVETYGAEVFLAVNGKLEGSFVISDTMKADAKAAVHSLKALGLHTSMLTGDSETSARAVASAAGIEEVHARLLPEEKLDILRNIRQAHGTVLFVGDGINDAPVLAGADVGAAMGSGADAAIEAADIVFMTSSTESIPEAVRIARGTSHIAMQNVIFALAVKIIVMILGLSGHANMWLAVFADTGVAMICVFNSIRILYKR